MPTQNVTAPAHAEHPNEHAQPKVATVPTGPPIPTAPVTAPEQIAFHSVEVGDSVKRALDRWEKRQWVPAMVHACNAVDGTAKKRYPEIGIASRFKRTIRDSLDVFRVMAAPMIDFRHTRFPIAVKSDLPDGHPDIADVLFGVHRWNRGHDEDLPRGFELTPYGPRPAGVHIWRTGRIQLPASSAIGLLAVAVFAPENKGEDIPDGYQLAWDRHVFFIRSWWGWQDHFLEIVNAAQIPQTALDFAESRDESRQV